MLTEQQKHFILSQFDVDDSWTLGEIRQRIPRYITPDDLKKILNSLVDLGILKTEIVRSSTLGGTQFSYSLTPKGERLVQVALN